MKLNYVIYKQDNDSMAFYPIFVHKIYAFGTATLKELKEGYLDKKYPELFNNGHMHCQIMYFLPNLQPSLWDNEKFY